MIRSDPMLYSDPEYHMLRCLQCRSPLLTLNRILYLRIPHGMDRPCAIKTNGVQTWAGQNKPCVIPKIALKSSTPKTPKTPRSELSRDAGDRLQEAHALLHLSEAKTSKEEDGEPRKTSSHTREQPEIREESKGWTKNVLPCV